MNRLAIHARAGLLLIMALMLPAATLAAPSAAYVMDGRTGKELYSQNANTRLHPASLTKMMTLYLAFAAVERGQVSLDTKFTVSTNAANKPPSRLGLRAGQQIELRYLIRAAAIKSANDAATVIAEGIGGSEAAFGQQMTAMARALGMNNTNFLNPHGLTAQGHYSTARDMSVLGRHLFYDFPQYYNIFSRRSADAGIAKVSSTNTRFLDAYKGADGIKTGYTRAAGFNLTASAQRGNKRIIATVMGGTSTAQRNATMTQMLDRGFQSAPARAREVRPQAPQLVAAAPAKRSVQTARAKPEPVPKVVLDRSAPPAPAAPARDSLSDALTVAFSTEPVAAAASTALSAAAVADGPRMTLLASPRPGSRPEGSTPDNGETKPAASHAATPQLASSARPPQNTRRALASAAPSQAAGEVRQAAQASTFPAAADRPASGVSTTRALTASAAPPPRAETVILASLASNSDADMAVETVSRRAQSSGGRDWGVSLGYQNSRHEAEQLLIRTALQESAVLDRAARGVSDTQRGFDARFTGMTQVEARLVCEKLTAKSMGCTVIGG